MTTAELIERLERAEAPSRELDAEIAALVHVDADGLDFEAFPEPSGKVTIYFPSKVKQAYAAPRYTASMDAALTLVPVGWEWSLYSAQSGFRPQAQLETEAMRHREGFEPVSAFGATPAIALCIAALRVKEADNG